MALVLTILPLHRLSTLGGYKVTTNISSKSVLQIGIRTDRQKPPLTLNQLWLSHPLVSLQNVPEFIFAVKLGLTDADLRHFQNLLNNRPRKNLNYKTPNEVIKNIILEKLH